MFKIRCPNFLRRFLVEMGVQSWADVQKACELKTDIGLQQDDISRSTQGRIQYAQTLLQQRQKQLFRAAGHVGTSLQPQQGQNRIGKHRQGAGAQRSSLWRDSQQSRRESRRPSESTNLDRVISCWNCEGDHMAADCPGPQLCFYCYKEGHYKGDCPTKPTVSAVSSLEGVSLPRQRIVIVLDRAKSPGGNDQEEGC